MILNKRTDIITGQKKDKKDLIRIVKTKDGKFFINSDKKGRGAYIAKDASPEKILKNKALHKAFRKEVSKAIYDKVIAELK